MIRYEPTLKLAIALHENHGVYALLIGSGVSRAAAIPTGWEIVLDLVRKVAAASGEDTKSDPEGWYRQKFGEPPDYSKVLDMLAATPSERMGLLHSYFEPTQDEAEKGLKVPTDAHKAIAKLVRYGYVRMILTTNFDRLIEKALEEAGITHDLISSEDDLKGAMPYIHSLCTVVKLNGDYRDTRIKNTPEELANYPETLNTFLDRVLDEFGLIVCGWSGEWDVALKSAILRCPTRRFTTFWLVKGELTSDAMDITRNRHAEVIRIESADKFFAELLEKVESLRELERPSPISTAVAVATVKQYLVESRHRIRLHDLIHQETERLYLELSSERFNTKVESVTKEAFQQRIRQYEALVERLMAMLAALSYHDTGDNADLLTRCIQRLVQMPRRDGSVALLGLQLYPALLVTYASGVSAFAAKRFLNLAAILRKTEYLENLERKPAICKLNVWEVFSHGADKWVPRPNAEHEYTPASNYLLELLRPVLKDYLPDSAKYEETFDVFEYALTLTYVDLVKDGFTPMGRFGWKYRYSEPTHPPIAQFVRNDIADSDMLRAGFFNGSFTGFEQIQREAIEILGRWKSHWL